MDWNEKQKEQVSHLNIELVHSLRATDSAFSSGESSIGVSCVKFGMLADEKDLDDLILMVAGRGQEIEKSAQVCVTRFLQISRAFCFAVYGKFGRNDTSRH